MPDFPKDLEAAILSLKEEMNAVILAHYYQDGEIQILPILLVIRWNFHAKRRVRMRMSSCFAA